MRLETKWFRIQGALANLGYEISDTTIGNILKRHGIEPAPERKRRTTWKDFVQAHWNVLAAIDFTTVEVWFFLLKFSALCEFSPSLIQLCRIHQAISFPDIPTSHSDAAKQDLRFAE